MDSSSQLRLAVIGAGAAGLTAAWLLRERHAVTLFEARARLGGHAWTWTVPEGPDAGLPLDLGFMVFNAENYPTLLRLFAALGVDDFGPSEMSFSSWDCAAGEGYALNWDPRTPFAERSNLAAGDPEPARLPRGLLFEMLRMSRRVSRQLDEGDLEGMSLADWAGAGGWSQALLERYVQPMGAAIWSSPADAVMDFPAAWFFGFFRNHGLLDLEEGPRWMHVRGGCGRYVEAIAAELEDARTSAAVEAVRREEEGVAIRAGGDWERFDGLIFATPADLTLGMLTDPDAAERRALSAWRYTTNRCVLHTDPAAMPPASHQASWNSTREPSGAWAQTYHLNRLQDHVDSAAQYYFTLNGERALDPARVLLEVELRHPGYTTRSLTAQAELRELGGRRRTWFCGAHLGYGFHEDAVASGLEVAEALGCRL